jgi:hypothetical protein
MMMISMLLIQKTNHLDVPETPAKQPGEHLLGRQVALGIDDKKQKVTIMASRSRNVSGRGNLPSIMLYRQQTSVRRFYRMRLLVRPGRAVGQVDQVWPGPEGSGLALRQVKPCRGRQEVETWLTQWVILIPVTR